MAPLAVRRLQDMSEEAAAQGGLPARDEGRSAGGRKKLKRRGSELEGIRWIEATRAGAILLARVGRALQTGTFINYMWGEAGTVLGAVQMFLIRLFMIWPLKAVAPAAYAYWAWELTLRLRGKSSRPQRPHGFWPLVKSTVFWGCKEAFRVWLAMEALFLLYYKFKHWQLERRVSSAPLLPPGKALEALRRALETVKMIQVGGKIAEPNLSSSRSLPMLSLHRGRSSPPITPKTSAQDLQAMLHTRDKEASVEDLLRDWHGWRQSAGNLDTPLVAVTDADRAAMEQLVDDAEVLALKQAEICGWFLQRPGMVERWPCSRVDELRRGNMEEWIAWAFFNCVMDDLPASRRQEVDELVEEITRWIEVPVQPGYCPQASAMRLTMDPIPAAHRPLLYYAVTQTVFSQVIRVTFRALGFRQYWSGTMAYWYRPPRAGGSAECAAGSGSGSSSGAAAAGPEAPSGSPPPIVFCHGIGVNVLPYRPFLVEMLERSPDRGFFLISLPHISMRIKEEVPSSSEMVSCLVDMLAAWGTPSAHFVGHSFGSLPLAWMARKAPQMVAAMTFIDPVCFLLIKPDVCYNFMYRRPADPTQLLINYFLARELYIAHSLSRNFFWHQNQLWPDELPCPTLVSLSGRDSIVPAHSVRRYLTAYKHRRNVATLRILWFEELGHGEINFGPVGEAACARIVTEMLRVEALGEAEPQGHKAAGGRAR